MASSAADRAMPLRGTGSSCRDGVGADGRRRVEPNIATATKERPGPSTRNGYSAANPIAYRTLSERPATAPESAPFVRRLQNRLS